MIRFDRVTFGYGLSAPLLRDFSLELPSGRRICLMAPSGRGKTTVLRLLLGLERPRRGSVTRPDGIRFSTVFQEDRLLPWKTVVENAALFSDKETACRILTQLGLGDSLDALPETLSGGMKRRAGIAQAMLNDPHILILDEPTAGLDPNERIRFRNLISELSEDRLVLLSTHIVSDVEYIASEIWLMNGGRITDQGSAEALIRNMRDQVWRCQVPRAEVSRYVAQFKVANIKAGHDGAELRIVAPVRPTPDAGLETPTLEDVFLYHFGETGGEQDAAL